MTKKRNRVSMSTLNHRTLSKRTKNETTVEAAKENRKSPAYAMMRVNSVDCAFQVLLSASPASEGGIGYAAFQRR